MVLYYYWDLETNEKITIFTIRSLMVIKNHWRGTINTFSKYYRCIMSDLLVSLSSSTCAINNMDQNKSHEFGSMSMKIYGHLFNGPVIISIVNMENLTYISDKKFIMMCRKCNIRYYNLRHGTHFSKWNISYWSNLYNDGLMARRIKQIMFDPSSQNHTKHIVFIANAFKKKTIWEEHVFRSYDICTLI